MLKSYQQWQGILAIFQPQRCCSRPLLDMPAPSSTLPRIKGMLRTIALLAFVLCRVAAAAPPSLEIESRIPVPGPVRWDYVTADSAAHRLYIAHGTQTDVLDTR